MDKNNNNKNDKNIKKLRLLSRIINKNSEFRPDSKSNLWREINGKKYKVMKRVLKYEITDELIKLMDEYTKVYKSFSKNKSKNKIMKKYNDNIALIYIMDNKRTKQSYIGYTTNPLFTFIKLNIHKKNIEEENVFDYFKYRKLTEFTFELLEYIKYDNRSDIYKRREYWQRKLLEDFDELKEKLEPYSDSSEESSIKSLYTVDLDSDKLFKKRMDILLNILLPFMTKFKKIRGYIYKLENTKNKKTFIGGDEKKLSKEDVIKKLKCTDNKSLDTDLKKLGQEKFRYKVIEKYLAKSPFDLMARIDYHKILNKSIEDGYNEGYCLDESEKLFGKRLGTRARERMERSIFLKINRYLFEKNLKDKTNYKKIYGFVYEIQHKKTKKRFISYAHNTTLKDKILGMYDNAVDGNVKHSKILKAISEEPYYNFAYSLLVIKKMDDSKIDIKNEAERLVIRYNTIEEGYNLDQKIVKSMYGRRKRT